MILNGKVFNPGQMRTRVLLQSRTITQDAGGFGVPIWTTVAAVWAKWNNAHGSEVWAAASVQAERPATAVIRYLAGVDTTYAVLKGTDRYEIVSVDDIEERHEYIEIKLKMMEEG